MFFRVQRPRGKSVSAALTEFFGKDISTLPITKRTFSPVDLPNLQTAFDRYYLEFQLPVRVLGYVSYHGDLQNSLRELISPTSYATIGPVQYRDVDINVDSHIQCLENGIHLLAPPQGKLAVHLRGESYVTKGSIELEVMSESPALAAALVEKIRESIRNANVYRSKIISLEHDNDGWGASGFNAVRFHRFEPLSREEIILPEHTLDLVERNTVHFFEHAAPLRKSGRSLKRGLLFHGKPGTGKTYTIRWLVQSIRDITVILMSAEQLWLVKQSCQIARMLAPSLVVLEDVDLVAAQRDETRHPYYQVSLHQLLNEMDGLDSDAQVMFVLTTNRPSVIEPALSLRPGRIDQAIEFPLPDSDCRRRLFHLYCNQLQIDFTDLDLLIRKTEGASPAFIQELVRKACLIAAEDNSMQDGNLLLTKNHFDTALHELVVAGGQVTRNLLGFSENQGQ